MSRSWRIAWVGNEFFRAHVARLGHEAVRVAVSKGEALDWDELCERAGFEPNLVVYADVSRPPVLLGVEEFPCLTLFYCIDSHLHAWYPFWAQAFDLAAVSLKGHLWRFHARLTPERVLWLPPAPQDRHKPDPSVEPEWDLLFAGNVSRTTTPKRYEFLERLGKLVPGLVVRKGRFEELFPRARLVLNIAEKGDLNFRVFEALACGACLVTPRVKHGLDDLFVNGRHLFTYDPRNIEDLAGLVRGLLDNPQRRERVAKAGHKLVEEKHRFVNRARSLMDLVDTVDPGRTVARRLVMAGTVRDLFLRDVLLGFARQYKDLPLGARYLEAGKKA